MAETPSRQKQAFDWTSVAPSDEHYRLALEEYYAGRSFPEIVTILESRGLSSDLIPDVTTALAKDRASHLFSAGKGRAEVREKLIERGLRLEDADSIAQQVERAREAAFAGVGASRWQMRWLIAGGAALFLGMVLYCLKGLRIMDAPTELVVGLIGGGILLAGLGGVLIMIRWGPG
jgi:hypothetical protein